MSSFSIHSDPFGIKSEFLDINNYKNTAELSKRRHEAYLVFCKLIKNYYNDYLGAMNYFMERIKISPNDNLISIKQFKEFLIDFAHIVQEVSKFKSEFYEQLEDMEINSIIRPTDQIKLRVTSYSQAQQSFQTIHENFTNNNKHLQGAYSQMKKETREPMVYFDQKYTKHKVQSILEYIKVGQGLQVEGNNILQVVYKNAWQFESDITSYRQRLISNKYKVHKKIQEMSKGAKECLTQTLLSLYEITCQRYKAFSHLVKDSLKESSLFQRFKRRGNQKDENNDKLTDIIISATQEYNNLINELEGIIKILSEGFTNLSKNIKEHSETAKQLAEELNKFYENDESPSPITIGILDLFSLFSQKLAEIPNLLYIQLSNLQKLRQNINKHSQITLSLMKCSNMKPLGSPNHGGNLGSNKNIDHLTHLFDQLSFDYLNVIIDKIYKTLESTIGYLKNYFNSKYHIKKKNHLDNSMEISYIEDQYKRPEKRPSAFERWIWKDFKNIIKYTKLSKNQAEIKQIKKFVQPFLEIKIESEKEIDKYSCSLSNKKSIIGVLRILQKNILFNSSNKSVEINIPYEYIEQVAIKVKIFEKQLNITTSIGEISFGQFAELSKAEVIIQQQLTANAGTTKTTSKKPSVELTTSQLAFINTRKATIQSQLESVEGYEFLSQAILQNVTIDTVYDTIYSDKPFKIKGKEEICFLSYTLKKTGGSNYVILSKYEPPGPKFYSLEEGKTFENTPLYSERVNQYEVPLPPIPFMPKTCTNTETTRLYWISHQQFDYHVKSQSKGAPYANTFYINFVHKICKKENNVEVKIYFRIVFVEDSMMKGTILSKSTEEIKNNITILLAEMAKILKSSGSASKEGNPKDEAQDEIEELKETNKSRSKHKVKTLQNQNKILIGVLAAVIIINLLLRFLG